MELSLSKIKTFLIYPEMDFLDSYSSYISRSRFVSSKNKKTHSKKCVAPSLKNSYISGRNFKVPGLKKLSYTFFLFFKSFRIKFKTFNFHSSSELLQ